MSNHLSRRSCWVHCVYTCIQHYVYNNRNIWGGRIETRILQWCLELSRLYKGPHRNPLLIQLLLRRHVGIRGSVHIWINRDLLFLGTNYRILAAIWLNKIFDKDDYWDWERDCSVFCNLRNVRSGLDVLSNCTTGWLIRWFMVDIIQASVRRFRRRARLGKRTHDILHRYCFSSVNNDELANRDYERGVYKCKREGGDCRL